MVDRWLGWVVGGCLMGSLLLDRPALAQIDIVPDNTLPTNSLVAPLGNEFYEIDGGTAIGKNLFHSFLRFNIGNLQEVTLLDPGGIENILVRVTGGVPSTINGLLGVNSNANLFLLNPSGISFGANSGLFVGGSFIATTADAIQFDDRTLFGIATGNALPTSLTVNPSALLFNQLSGQRGAIEVRSSLSVFDPQSLLLVGGDVRVDGGSLLAPRGRVELGGVAGTGSVALVRDGGILGLHPPSNLVRANLLLTNRAFIQAEDGGSVSLWGQTIQLLDGTQVVTTTGDAPGGNLTVDATRLLELAGESGTDPSGLFARTNGNGNAGELTIVTRRLLVRDGAQISASTLGSGRGGNLTVNASESSELMGNPSARDATGLFSQTFATGTAGNVTVSTPRLVLRQGAGITVSSIGGTGQAGDLQITAGSVFLTDGSLIIAESATNDGGNITLAVQNLLQLRQRSEISATAGRSGSGGDGGNLIISPNLLIALEESTIAANAFQGRGGNIRITASGVFLAPGSTITATSTLGIDGVVEVQTPDTNLENSLTRLSSALVNAEQIVAGSCLARRSAAQGSFTVTGVGGIARNPYDPFHNRYDLAQVQPIAADPPTQPVAVAPSIPSWQLGDPIQEAQGLMTDTTGQAVLVREGQLSSIAAQNLICDLE